MQKIDETTPVSDATTPVADLKKFVLDFNKARDWEKYNNPYDVASALSVEASEILQLLLWNKNTDVYALIAAEPKLKDCLANELADVLAYLLTLSGSLDVDLTEAFFTKMEKLGQKYPIGNKPTPARTRWLE